MLEVEAKYRTDAWDAIRATLAEWGTVADPPRVDADHYFNAPDRDLRETDEAVRLRRIGETNVLTYKGPRRDAETKTRPEVEVPLAPGNEAADAATRFLVGLRYRPVAVVTKRREVLRFRRAGWPFEACFDDLGALGRFVELEILADEADYESAKAALLATAAELGLIEQEKRSYLRMTVEAGEGSS
jgi:adenylate cyclase class 2